MKFQNVTDERTDTRTEGWTDGRTDKPKAICPFNFFKVGGIKNTDHDLSYCEI